MKMSLSKEKYLMTSGFGYMFVIDKNTLFTTIVLFGLSITLKVRLIEKFNL